MQEATGSGFLRAAGYRRVSMREQVDGFSLDAQENSITKYAREQGWKLINIYQDAGISAKKGSHRPAFENLLADAKLKKFDVVIVDKVDRFYRHLGGLLTTLDVLNSYGVSFVSVQERIDFTSPWGKLMLSVLGTLAEIYLDNLRQEVRKGKLQRARQGLWLGGTPFGYCNGLCSKCTDPNGQGYCPEFGQPDKRNGKALVLHPVESKVVAQAFDWYTSENYSFRTIADNLNQFEVQLSNNQSVPARQKGLPGRSAPHSFNRDTVRDLLGRMAYAGKLTYQGVDKDGKHRKRKNPSEIFEATHDAIISLETFEKAKEIRETRYKNCFSRNDRPVRVYMLTGILHCGYCGGSMRGVSNGYRRYYVDGNQRDKSCHCPQKTIYAEEFEKQFLDWINGIFENINLEEDIQNEAVAKIQEKRLNRSKDLFLLGEIDYASFVAEKKRTDDIKEALHVIEARSIIKFVQESKSQLLDWEHLSQLKRKRLLQGLVATAYVRESAFVAAQPTFAFQPTVASQSQGLRACNSGEGGIRTRDWFNPALT